MYRFDENAFGVSLDSLADIRKAIYHSQGPGYFIFPGFVSGDHLAHMRKIWTEFDPYLRHAKKPPGRVHDGLSVLSPNWAQAYDDGSRNFFNFFWNEPFCQVTEAVSAQVAILRNRIMGRQAVDRLFGYGPRSIEYRVVISRTEERIVPVHRDWAEREGLDVSELQITLCLSEWGKDYSGDGFVFETTQGKRIVFGKDVPVKAGDLIIWRYNNQHAVLNIHTEAGQIGFMRMIFPPQEVKNRAALLAEQAAYADKISTLEAENKSLQDELAKFGGKISTAAATAGLAPEGMKAPTQAAAPTPAAVTPKAPAEHTNSGAGGKKPVRTSAAPASLSHRIKSNLSRTSVGRGVLVPIYRRLKGGA